MRLRGIVVLFYEIIKSANWLNPAPILCPTRPELKNRRATAAGAPYLRWMSDHPVIGIEILPLADDTFLGGMLAGNAGIASGGDGIIYRI